LGITAILNIIHHFLFFDQINAALESIRDFKH